MAKAQKHPLTSKKGEKVLTVISWEESDLEIAAQLYQQHRKAGRVVTFTTKAGKPSKTMKAFDPQAGRMAILQPLTQTAWDRIRETST